MFTVFDKEGPPIIIEVYVDGRASVFIPSPPRLREKTLFRMLNKALKKGQVEMQDLKPGRYKFNFTKVGIMSANAELTSEDGESHG